MRPSNKNNEEMVNNNASLRIASVCITLLFTISSLSAKWGTSNVFKQALDCVVALNFPKSVFFCIGRQNFAICQF